MNNIVPFNPQEAVALARMMKSVVMEVRRDVLKEGVDFGAIPGTDKPVLLKPGAERLCSAFKLYPVFSVVSQVEDWECGIFFYRYECALVHRETGECFGRGIGSCNSQEGKYGWRWVSEDRIPPHLDKSTLATRNGSFTEFDFAINKAETIGKYGKPREYWEAFAQAMQNGTAVKGERKTAKGMGTTYSIGGLEYRIPNIDVFDLVNTIDKMGQKRALIAATLIATNASEFFNQDIEDFDPAVFGIKAPTITIETSTAVNNSGQYIAAVLPEYSAFMDAAHFDQMKTDLRAAFKSLSLSGDDDARRHIEQHYGFDIDMDALRAARKESAQ